MRKQRLMGVEVETKVRGDLQASSEAVRVRTAAATLPGKADGREDA